MRVARSLTPREVRVEEAADPEPGSGDVVCRVLACGVCGSDVLDTWVARKVPTVLGHELAAEVTAIGAQVDGVAVGDRVVVHHHAPCGECRRCRRGHETLCERFRATALDPGGFAEQVRVPADLVGELLVLGGLDAERATFVEPLACVLRAFERCGLRAGDSLLVVGCGTSGLLAIAAAHARAVEAVWAREARWPSAPSATATSSSTWSSSAPRSPTRSRPALPRSLPAAPCACTRPRIRATPSASTATPSTSARSTCARPTRPAPATCAPRWP
jgi:L-iditol 2-dehydrogenase